MIRNLVFAAFLVAIAGYLMYPSQDNEAEIAVSEEPRIPAVQATEGTDKAYNFVRSQATVGASEGDIGSEVADEDLPLHIGEFIDPDDTRAFQGGEPLHIGQFVDPDAVNYVVDDEVIHIGEDLSAYDPMEYTNEEEVEPLHIGKDLSAYAPLDIVSGAVEAEVEDAHIGKPIPDPL